MCPLQLRLTAIETADRTVVRVAGRLALEGIGELERVCVGRQGLLVLDLADLVTMDDAGVATLRRLSCAGVRLANASPYIALLLDPTDADAV